MVMAQTAAGAGLSGPLPQTETSRAASMDVPLSAHSKAFAPPPVPEKLRLAARMARSRAEVLALGPARLEEKSRSAVREAPPSANAREFRPPPLPEKLRAAMEKVQAMAHRQESALSTATESEDVGMGDPLPTLPRFRDTTHPHKPSFGHPGSRSKFSQVPSRPALK